MATTWPCRGQSHPDLVREVGQVVRYLASGAADPDGARRRAAHAANAGERPHKALIRIGHVDHAPGAVPGFVPGVVAAVRYLRPRRHVLVGEIRTALLHTAAVLVLVGHDGLEHDEPAAVGELMPPGARLGYGVHRVDHDRMAESEVRGREFVGDAISDGPDRRLGEPESHDSGLDRVDAQIDRPECGREPTAQRRLPGARPAGEHDQQRGAHAHDASRACITGDAHAR